MTGSTLTARRQWRVQAVLQQLLLLMLASAVAICLPGCGPSTSDTAAEPASDADAEATLDSGDVSGADTTTDQSNASDGADVPWLRQSEGAGAGGAPVAENGLQSTETGNPDVSGENASTGDGPNSTCQWEHWESPAGPPLQYRCSTPSVPINESTSGASGSLVCDCHGSMQSVELEQDETCEQALGRACGVDTSQPTHCEKHGGTCWRGGDDATWNCACGEIDEAALADLSDVSADSCAAAAFAHCSRDCSEPDLGECTPELDSQTYICDCDAYPAQRRGFAPSCGAALAQCDSTTFSGFGSFGCRNAAGFCDLTPEEARCHCIDGSSGTLSYDDLAEHGLQPPRSLEEILDLENEECFIPLDMTCGTEAELREQDSCSRTTEHGRTCKAEPNLEGGGYDCRCYSTSECLPRFDQRFPTSSLDECTAALDACATDDDSFVEVAPQSAPACPDEEASECSGVWADRFCVAQHVEDDTYSCQCSAVPEDDAEPSEHLLDDMQSCNNALDTCFEEDTWE